MAISKITYFINLYDRDGDLFETGVFFNIGDSFFKVCDTPEELADVIDHIDGIQQEIINNS